MRVDSSGRVTKPYQPLIYARRTGGTWTNYNTGSNYIFNTADLNNGNCLNTSTGIFTCPVSGYYKVTVGAIMGQGGASCYFQLRKNGSQYADAMHCNMNGTSAWPTSSHTWIVSCSTNDTLNIFATTNNIAGKIGRAHV